MTLSPLPPYNLTRLSDHPILTTASVKPHGEGFEVLGVFNPAACRFENEILLLLRVAEAPLPQPGWLQVPVVDHTTGQLAVHRL